MIQMSTSPSKLSSSKSDISPIDIEHPAVSPPASLAISTETSKTEIETSTMDEMLDALELLDLVNEAWICRKIPSLVTGIPGGCQVLHVDLALNIEPLEFTF